MSRRTGSVALLLALAGCGQPGDPHDVAHFAVHPQARAEAVARCNGDLGAQRLAECRAAFQAEGRAESRRALQYTPPPSRVTSPDKL